MIAAINEPPSIRCRAEDFKGTHHELGVHFILLLHEVELLASGDIFFVVWGAMQAFDDVEGFLTSALGQ